MPLRRLGRGTIQGTYGTFSSHVLADVLMRQANFTYRFFQCGRLVIMIDTPSDRSSNIGS